jgi:hypothetical protein
MTQTMVAKAPFAALGCAIWFAVDTQLKELFKTGEQTHREMVNALGPYLDEPDYDILLAIHECLFGIYSESLTPSLARRFEKEIPGFDMWVYEMEDSLFRAGDYDYPSFIRERAWTNSSKLLRWMRGEYDTKSW